MIKITNELTAETYYIERVKRGNYVAHYFDRVQSFRTVQGAGIYLRDIIGVDNIKPLTELKDLASGLYHFDAELTEWGLLNQPDLTRDTRDWLQAINKQSQLFNNGMDTKLQETFITTETADLLRLI